jgi:hypothetical protein
MMVEVLVWEYRQYINPRQVGLKYRSKYLARVPKPSKRNELECPW